jgi:hypothetical protein
MDDDRYEDGYQDGLDDCTCECYCSEGDWQRGYDEGNEEGLVNGFHNGIAHVRGLLRAEERILYWNHGEPEAHKFVMRFLRELEQL